MIIPRLVKSAASVEITWRDQLSDLHPDWDALALSRSFFSCRRYLAYANSDIGSAFAVEASVNGSLCAAAAGWIADGSGHPYLEPHSVLNGLGVKPGRYLVVGSPWAFSGQILLSDAGCPEPVLSTLVTYLSDRAEGLSAKGVVGLYLDTESVVEVADAAPHGGAVLINFDAVIRTPMSFEDYLARFPSRIRRKIRREITRFDEAGLKCGVQPLAECLSELAPLIAQTENRYGNDVSSERVTAGLTRQLHCFADSLVAFTARSDDGTLVAGAVAVVDDDTVHGRLVGVDRERYGHSFEYFNVAYYEPVRYAIRTQRSAVRLGIESIMTKVLRGAELEPRWAFDLSGLWDKEAARDWNQAQVDAIAGLVSQHPWAFDESWLPQLCEFSGSCVMPS